MNCSIYTMCLIMDGDYILLQNRPSERGFPGFLAPGGKVELSESISDAAIREVKEETGLEITELQYKGLDEYSTPEKDERYMVFNYVATKFEGELLEHPPEGELVWVHKDEAEHLPMQDWFKRRLPLFFKEGTFEIHILWNETERKEEVLSIKQL